MSEIGGYNSGGWPEESGQIGNNNNRLKDSSCITCVMPHSLSQEDMWFLEDNCFPWEMIEAACNDFLAGREISCAVNDALRHPERDDIFWVPEFHDTPLVTQEIWRAALDKRLVYQPYPGSHDLRDENHPSLIVNGVRLFDVMHGQPGGHSNGSKSEREAELKAMSPAALALLIAG